MQPYLLELYGDNEAYAVAGVAAAIIAGAQIAGGFLVPHVRKLFKKRTTVIALSFATSAVALLGFGLINNFWVALIIIVVWAISFAISSPIRQAYLNDIFPSSQRATLLSFDSLLASSGGVLSQPALGRVADVYSLSSAYVVSSGVQLLSVPFILATRALNTKADKISK
jgi:MFS family permease